MILFLKRMRCFWELKKGLHTVTKVLCSQESLLTTQYSPPLLICPIFHFFACEVLLSYLKINVPHYHLYRRNYLLIILFCKTLLYVLKKPTYIDIILCGRVILTVISSLTVKYKVWSICETHMTPLNPLSSFISVKSSLV